MLKQNFSQLLGIDDQHLVYLPDHKGVKVHHGIVDPLVELMQASREEGFNLRVASGYRSFARQRLIWNKKSLGERPILDELGQVIAIDTLSSFEKIKAILRWSALPGASRHHWGTECDIYDLAAMPKNYQLQLHPDEYTGNGIFAPMMEWLSAYLQQSNTPDFYRPFANDHGGVAPELWHISYRPLSEQYTQQYSLELLRDYLQQLPLEERIEEQPIVIENLPYIYQRFLSLPA